jgi:hypothetical protein
VARVVVLGCPALLDVCRPDSVPQALEVLDAPRQGTPAALQALAPDAVVAFGPVPETVDLLARSALPALLWWPEADGAPAVGGRQRLVLAAGDRREAWRCVCLPVADRLYAAPDPAEPARAAWLGGPTQRRSEYLSRFHHALPVLPEERGHAAVAVNLHDDGRPAFEHRAASALARGRLLVSETLVPARGLEPGIDYLEGRDLDDVFLCIESAVRDLAAFRRVRLRGRRKAELFRASRVVDRLVNDLLREIGTRPA